MFAQLEKVLLKVGQTLSASDAPKCALCFIQKKGLSGFEYPLSNNFVTESVLPNALKDEIYETPAIVVRLFFGVETLCQSQSISEFTHYLNSTTQNQYACLFPFFAPDDPLTSEPCLAFSWTAEMRITGQETKELKCEYFGSEASTICEYIQKTPEPNHMNQSESRATFQTASLGSQEEAHVVKNIETVQLLQKQGDCYLVNLANRIETSESGNCFHIFSFLKEWLRKQSRFGCFVSHEDFGLLCFSPERFLCLKDEWVLTEPIKGTVKIDDFASTTAAAEALWKTEKEINEQCMVVDLLRNDLNIVCEPGSVHVHNPFYVRKAGTLLQMQSFVFGKKRTGVFGGAFWKQILPAGSVTGTPKRRVCEVIKQVEGNDRGFYTGVFSIQDSPNDLESVVLIRSYFRGFLGTYVGVGAGITTLSVAQVEAVEFRDKLESFRWCDS